jgi:hypothetical protein
MIVKRGILQKALIPPLLTVLTAELTIFGAAASAQIYETGLESATSPSPIGNAISSGAPDTPMQSSSLSEGDDATQLGITATLLGVPIYGRAPLTGRLLCRISKSRRFASLSVELRRWRGIVAAGRRVHTPRLPVSRNLPVLARSDYCARALDHSSHDPNPTASALGEVLQSWSSEKPPTAVLGISRVGLGTWSIGVWTSGGCNEAEVTSLNVSLSSSHRSVPRSFGFWQACLLWFVS